MKIFISGVHGVGKSFLCDEFIKLNSNFTHLSSSELISSVRKKSWDNRKVVLTPEENQSALLRELEKYNHKKNILLDGHFCLINKNNEIIKLDHSIYKKMELSAIVLLENDTDIIKERFKRRKAEISFSLDDLIKKERENAIEVSKNYNIRLEIINSDDINHFNSLINDIYLKQKNEH